MVLTELKPCERAVYLHHLISGPLDGRIVPSSHHYEWYEEGRARYIDSGQEPVPCDPGGWQAINCTDEYAEPVFLRVTMVPQ